jgi:hypothetical protein
MNSGTINMAIAAVALALGAGRGWAQPFQTSLDYAQVVNVVVVETGPRVFRFDVTVRHQDEGWDHYANRWEVLDGGEGTVLGERVLLHPHDNEQPFTRSQSGISVPEGLDEVVVRARCNVHGFGGKTVVVSLQQGRRDDHEVRRR